MKYSTLVFDLGNVLFYFDHMKICSFLSEHSPQSPEKIYETVFKKGLSIKFDCGLISTEEFWDLLKTECQLSCSFKKACSGWEEIFSPNEKIISLLPALRKKYPKLIICSNTNVLHFEYLTSRWPEIFQYFDHYSLSFTVHSMKPDNAIFEDVISHSRGRIIFFDDISAYTEAAEKLGITGIVYSHQDVSELLLSDVHS